MKKLLAMLMATVMIFSVVAGFTALADEPTEEPAVAEETPAVAEPSEKDQETLMHYIVFDFKDPESLKATVYMTGNDAVISYYKNMYAQYGSSDVKDGEYMGKKALIVQELPLTKDGLIDVGLATFEEKGLFGTKTTYVYPIGDPSKNSGETTPGKVLQTYVFDLGSRPCSCTQAVANKDGVIKEVKAGENNSFMFTTFKINWINTLIAIMLLIVIILIVVILVVKKKQGKANGDVVEEPKAEETISNEEIEKILEEENNEVIEENIEEVVEEPKEEKTEE